MDDFKGIHMHIYSGPQRCRLHKMKITPNIIGLKSLEPFELFIMEIPEKEEKEKSNTSPMWCCHFKEDARIFFTQFEKREQELNMNNLNDREILNSVKTTTVYPMCEMNRSTGNVVSHQKIYHELNRNQLILRKIFEICRIKMNMFPYAEILSMNICESFISLRRKRYNRIAIFYYTWLINNERQTFVYLISIINKCDLKVCVKQYKFAEDKKIYISMQRSDTVNVININPFFYSTPPKRSLKAYSMDVILERLAAKLLTMEDLENLKLPRTIFEEMIKGLQIYRHLQ
ncbi:uncharacterized protein LOC116846407 [Odontomachus brunneus]|uniref:uncharacterized protein LOC116846407 n=1 Tax=Odontomachus brunneus TaxID=486640 RepID=UPI0013F228AB|nr:uncharacterized protein LOC116846407 [Odontomachus brunneus]